MIVINARFLTQEISGVQRFAEQIALALAGMRKDLIFVAPHGIRQHDSAHRLGAVCIGHNSGHLWEQLDLPLWLADNGNPLLLSLGSTSPVFYGKQLATHHDITYVRHPQSYSWLFRTAYRWLMPLVLRRATRLITSSRFSQSELANFYRYPAERIEVVPCAVGPAFRTFSSGPSEGQPRYLLAVSSHNPHKNFARLTTAFLSLTGCDDVELRIVGSSNPVVVGSDPQIATHPRVRIMGRLSDEELIEAYQGATAFIFPSLYEGFGIPPLEAQACGCPVIAAHAAAIPEVLGESAVYFDPYDIDDMALAMRRVLDDAVLRNELREAGLANAERYSWQRSAARVSCLLDTVLQDDLSATSRPKQATG